jgi:hypothetical protein
LIRRPILVLLARSLRGWTLGLLTPLLRATLLHLLAVCAHLLLVLTLLVAAEHAQDLAPQIATRRAIAGTAFGMGLRIPIDHRRNTLLLVAGKVELSEPFHPVMRNPGLAGSRALLGRKALWLTLLGVGAERHRERDH